MKLLLFFFYSMEEIALEICLPKQEFNSIFKYTHKKYFKKRSEKNCKM